MLVIPLFTATPPQRVSLPNGNVYELMGATYGTNHAVGTTIGRLLYEMPASLQRLAFRVFDANRHGVVSTRTTAPVFILWIRDVSPAILAPGMRSGTPQVVLESGGTSGSSGRWTLLGGTGAVEFSNFPRRDRTLLARFVERSSGAGTVQEKELGRFQLRNPALAKAPHWIPEPLPATKKAGDLEVELVRFHSRAGSRRTDVNQKGGSVIRYAEPAGALDRGWAMDARFRSPRPSEEWTIHGATLLDATGNRLPATSHSGSGGHFRFQPVLWENERAWKMELTLKRKAEFPEEDLIAFADLQIPATNAANSVQRTQTLLGVKVTLDRIVKRPPVIPNSCTSGDFSQVRIKHSRLPPDVSLDLVRVEFDPGEPVREIGSGASANHQEYQFTGFPEGATTMTIWMAVQKVRHVEFLVDPKGGE